MAQARNHASPADAKEGIREGNRTGAPYRTSLGTTPTSRFRTGQAS